MSSLGAVFSRLSQLFCLILLQLLYRYSAIILLSAFLIKVGGVSKLNFSQKPAPFFQPIFDLVGVWKSRSITLIFGLIDYYFIEILILMPFLPFLWASLQTPFLWVSLPQRFHFYGHFLNFEFLFWKH
jgi:hypothetical protein